MPVRRTGIIVFLLFISMIVSAGCNKLPYKISSEDATAIKEIGKELAEGIFNKQKYAGSEMMKPETTPVPKEITPSPVPVKHAEVSKIKPAKPAIKKSTPKAVPSLSPSPPPVRPEVPAIPSNYSFKYMREMEKELLRYVNIEREKAGVKPLVWEDKLRETAEYKANEMLQYKYFAHTSPYTGEPFKLAREVFKYNTTGFGENLLYYGGITANNVSAEKMVEDWMGSEGHKENILRAEWKKMGGGIVYCSSKKYTYGVQHFSR